MIAKQLMDYDVKEARMPTFEMISILNADFISTVYKLGCVLKTHPKDCLLA